MKVQDGAAIRQYNAWRRLFWLKVLEKSEVMLYFLATVLVLVAVILPVKADTFYWEAEKEALAEASSSLDGYGEEADAAYRARWLATQGLFRAILSEPSVTAMLQSLQGEGIFLAGLEHRLKDRESLARKIISDAAEKGISLEAAADSMGDILRYTFVMEAERYADSVPALLAALAAMGFAVLKFRNAWGGKFYQGVNARLRAPDGTVLEVQFHTPQSYQIKQDSHAFYETRRSPAATAGEIADAIQKSIDINRCVIVPKGAMGIANPCAA